MSRTKKKEGAVRGKTTNRIINILLALGCLTVLFPLYMTVIIAFKKPSEMTNDVAGALAFPGSAMDKVLSWLSPCIHIALHMVPAGIIFDFRYFIG